MVVPWIRNAPVKVNRDPPPPPTPGHVGLYLHIGRSLSPQYVGIRAFCCVLSLLS